MMKIFLFFLAAILLAGCLSRPITGETVTTSSGSYQNVSAAELHELLEDKDFVLVNVHIPFAGNIAGTDLSIPYDQIEQNLAKLPSDKNAKILLYCRSGRMSEIAAEDLTELGYTNVWNLEGGMVQWEQAGFEIER